MWEWNLYGIWYGVMIKNSTTSSGWEYLIIMKEFKFESYWCQLVIYHEIAW